MMPTPHRARLAPAKPDGLPLLLTSAGAGVANRRPPGLASNAAFAAPITPAAGPPRRAKARWLPMEKAQRISPAALLDGSSGRVALARVHGADERRAVGARRG